MLCATIAEGCFVVRGCEFVRSSGPLYSTGLSSRAASVCVSLIQITSGALIRARGVSRPFDIQMTI